MIQNLLLSLFAFGLVSNVQAARVSQVEVLGVQAVSREDVSASIEVFPNEDFADEGLTRSIESLKKVYRNKGFFKTEVSVKIDKKKILQFQVKEGTSSSLNKVLIEPMRSVEGFEKRRWDQALREFYSRFEIKSGETLSDEKINSAKKLILDILSATEHIGANVKDVKVDVLSEQPQLADIKMVIDPGRRITFGFRGSEVFSETELKSWIDELRVLGLGQEYLRDIESKIKTQYLDAGYSQMSIESYAFEQRHSDDLHVTWVIREGVRNRIDKIQFDGNLIFSGQELEAKLKEQSSPVVQSGYFVERVLESAAERVIEWMKSRGFLGAKLLSVSKVTSSKGDRTRVVVYLYEGEQTVIHSARTSGNTYLVSEEVLAILGVQEGLGLNLFLFNEGLEVLKQKYRAAGYLDFRIKNEGTDGLVQYSDENRQADIGVIFDEGERYRIESIEMPESLSVDRDIVQREIGYREGDLLEEPRLLEAESRLRRLGVFSGVKTVIEDGTKTGFKKIKIELQDGTPGAVGGGVGFRNDIGLRLFAQSSYGNLWRRNHTVFLNATTNRRYQNFHFIEYQTQLGYQWPWFLDLPEVTFRPRVTVEKTQYRNLGVSSIAFASTWERRILKKPLVTGLFTYSLERVRQFETGIELDPIDNQTLRIGSVIPALRLDTRDSPLAPTKGVFSNLSYEYSDPIFLSQSDPFPVGYTRVQFRSDFHIPIFTNTQIYFSFRTGYERNNKTPDNEDPNNPDKRYAIPLVKQFNLGGIGSLRGFEEQELNYQKFAIRGTMSYVNYRVQLDLPFAGALRFGPFLDAGNLLIDRYSFGSLRYGTGAGFHYLTPVGSVNFDWGVKIEPRPGEDPSFFYFSIGVI